MIKNTVINAILKINPNTDYQNIQEWAKIEGNNIIDNGA